MPTRKNISYTKNIRLFISLLTIFSGCVSFASLSSFNHWDIYRSKEKDESIRLPTIQEENKHTRHFSQLWNYSSSNSKHNQDQKQFETFTPTLVNNSWILPKTRFTDQILHLVDFYQTKRSNLPYCGASLIVTVPNNSTVPHLKFAGKRDIGKHYKNALEKWLFPATGHKNNQRILPPGNLTLAFSIDDWVNIENEPHRFCFANSAKGGEQSVFNFEDVERWATNQSYPPPLPWNQRKTVPVFRGIGWGLHGEPYPSRLQKQLDRNINQKHMTPTKAGRIFFQQLMRTKGRHQRLPLVWYSIRHPKLVDGRLSGHGGFPEAVKYWKNNATNGLYHLLPFDTIPENRYFTEYEVGIVMGGLGAAFRTARTMSQEIAIILQDIVYEEWFTHIMIPFVHYIPLRQDLSNLEEILNWVQNNPEKVHAIALNGKAFYDHYLSYEAMSDFYYELIFRLMLCCSQGL